MVGVADGVGSWWEGGINPADYARALMHACRGSCVRMREEIELHPQRAPHPPSLPLPPPSHPLTPSLLLALPLSPLISLPPSLPPCSLRPAALAHSLPLPPPLPPPLAEVLQQAWADMQRSELVGSSTVCLVALHPHKAELRAANVGDSAWSKWPS